MSYTFNPFTGNLDYYQSASGGSPGGDVNSIQFNDSGSFNGFGTWDGTNLNVGLGHTLRIPMPAPTNPTVVGGTNGSLTAGTYYGVIVGVDAEGNTSLPSSEVSFTIAPGDSGSGSGIFTWDQVVQATSFRIYFGTTPGGEGHYFRSAIFLSGAINSFELDDLTSNVQSFGEAPIVGTPPLVNTAFLVDLPQAVTNLQIGQLAIGAVPTGALSPFTTYQYPQLTIMPVVGNVGPPIVSFYNPIAENGNSTGGFFFNAFAGSRTIPEPITDGSGIGVLYFADLVSQTRIGNIGVSAFGADKGAILFFTQQDSAGSFHNVSFAEGMFAFGWAGSAGTPSIKIGTTGIEAWRADGVSMVSVTASDFIVAGSAFKTDQVSGHQAFFQAYNGSSYVTLATMTNAATPTFDLAATVTIDGSAIVTATSSTAFTNKTGNISQWTNDSNFTTLSAVAGVGYLTSVTAHNLLSATHGDTTAASVVRGDLITGQGATPKWARLAKGTANQVLAMDGTATDIAWITPASSGVTSIATTSPISGGTITSTGTISLLVNTDFAFTAAQTITRANILTVSTDGLVLTNTTAAPSVGTNGLIGQLSPRLHFIGQFWNRTAGASQQAEFILEATPKSQTSTAASVLSLTSISNGTAGLYTTFPFVASGGSGALITLDGVNGNASGFGSINASNQFASFINSAATAMFHSAGIMLGSSIALQWFSGAPTNSTTADLALVRDGAANILGLRNSTNAQRFNIYNTFTSSSVFEDLSLYFSSNIAHIGTATTGATARALQLDYGGTTTAAISIPITSGAVTFGGGITLPGGATFLTTNTALTDGAGAGLGTLATAPAAGNPTKWIGINDNGTTRYIPAW